MCIRDSHEGAVPEFTRIVNQLSHSLGMALADAEAQAILRFLSVSAAFDVAMEAGSPKGWPPAFHQPKHVILISEHRLQVLLYGFIGLPLKGDRPTDKSAPFCIKVQSPNLLGAKQDTERLEYCVVGTNKTRMRDVVGRDFETRYRKILEDPDADVISLLST
eukprot:TRINITY_DN14018_c0_g2_i1.p1 TRINITY_DN14018_c0_g2~~TRINITY_DN14018_c0_g2_i1.p1  ORF type:complete len:162 (+),score=29.71 TRINITY_DN14018_c0_g2_i1:176-661(+)